MELKLLCFISIWIVCGSVFNKKECQSEAGLDCLVYYSNNYTECTTENLQQVFPYLYHREDGLYPAAPSVFNVSPIEKPYKNRVYPGVNVTLKVPLDASFKFVKGFQLFRKTDIPTDLSCYIFAFNGTDLNATSKSAYIKFEIWAINVKMLTFYDFEVFSLPLPPSHEMIGNSLTKSVRVNPNYSLANVPSANWVTTIGYYYNSKDKFIYIQFAKPPDQYGFKNFIIRLEEIDSDGNKTTSVKEVVISGFEHWFNQLKPGIYRVTVEPESTFLECYCKNVNDVCVSCVRTATKNIVLSNVPEAPSSSPPISVTWEPANDDDSGKILAAVLGSMLGATLISILFYIFYKKRLQVKEEDNFKSPAVPDPCIDYGHNNGEAYINPGVNPGMRQPTVLIVSAEDHVDHINAVGAFARFLYSQCNCNVIYAPWCLHEYLDNKFKWVIGTIERADFVIIVNSELSYYQYQSWKNKEHFAWKPPEPSQTYDLFTASINQITRLIISADNHFKCIIVHFNYTKGKFSLEELCAGSEYLIPKHVHELMCQIHKMDGRTASYNNGGYYADLLDSTQDGKYLLQCIDKAAVFELQHPNWLSDYYRYSNGSQYDSGISSPSVSLEETRHSPCKIKLDNKNKHINPGISTQNNLNRNVVPRQESYEDNSHVRQMLPAYPDEIQISQPSCMLRTSDPYSYNSEDPRDYFEAPSVIDDEDIESRQLQQEIIDFNNRTIASQFYNTHGIDLSEIDGEVRSLGGQSV